MTTVSLKKPGIIKALLFFLLANQQPGQPDKENTGQTPESTGTIEDDKNAKAADQTLLQRKVYSGQFMAGPLVMLHPGLLQ